VEAARSGPITLYLSSGLSVLLAPHLLFYSTTGYLLLPGWSSIASGLSHGTVYIKSVFQGFFSRKYKYSCCCGNKRTVQPLFPFNHTMQPDPSWTPDLPARILSNESIYFTGTFLSEVAFGAAVTLGLQCLALLRSSKATGSTKARNIWSIIVLFILSSAAIHEICGQVHVTMAWVYYRNFPGWPGMWT
jgi:hypothetical protein